MSSANKASGLEFTGRVTTLLPTSAKCLLWDGGVSCTFVCSFRSVRRPSTMRRVDAHTRTNYNGVISNGSEKRVIAFSSCVSSNADDKRETEYC